MRNGSHGHPPLGLLAGEVDACDCRVWSISSSTDAKLSGQRTHAMRCELKACTEGEGKTMTQVSLRTCLGTKQPKFPAQGSSQHSISLPVCAPWAPIAEKNAAVTFQLVFAATSNRPQILQSLQYCCSNGPTGSLTEVAQRAAARTGVDLAIPVLS
jgi:hypothetical protein